jgi:Transposase DDE domain group 1
VVKEGTLRVQATNSRSSFEVTTDGTGVVGHAGAALLRKLADRLGLTKALGWRDPRGRRHPDADVLRDLAVLLADGGDCLSDLAVLGDQPALFGPVASTPTAWRVVERTASDPAVSAPPRRRPHRPPCPPPHPAAASLLALGARAGPRVRSAAGPAAALLIRLANADGLGLSTPTGSHHAARQPPEVSPQPERQRQQPPDPSQDAARTTRQPPQATATTPP